MDGNGKSTALSGDYTTECTFTVPMMISLPPSVIIIDAVMSFSFSIFFFLSPFRWTEPFKDKERPEPDAAFTNKNCNFRRWTIEREEGDQTGISSYINQTTRGVLFYFFGPWSVLSFELCTSEREEDKEKAN